MLEYVYGDILESDCEAVVNTVNTVGVMGKGLALQFKLAYPLMFEEYRRICSANELAPGSLHIYKNPTHPAYIVNFATKDHWRCNSKYKWIHDGLVHLWRAIIDRDIKSVAIPALGCANGGLEWNKVQKMLENWHKAFFTERIVKVYPPKNTP